MSTVCTMPVIHVATMAAAAAVLASIGRPDTCATTMATSSSAGRST